jgi:hypothetical protein
MSLKYEKFKKWELLKMSHINGHYATSRKIAGSIPDQVTGFLKWSNSSSRNRAPGSTKPLTEISTTNLLGGKGRPAHKVDNLTAVCEPTF